MMAWITAYLTVGLVVGALVHQSNRNEITFDVQSMLDAVNYPDGKPLSLRLREWLANGLAYGLLLALWPVAGAVALYEYLRQKHSGRGADVRDSEEQEATPKFCACEDNLIESVGFDAAESLELVDDPLGAVPAVPFGFLYEAWVAFRAEALPGDELWSFRTGPNEKDWLWGTVRGYALHRDGKIVAEYLVEGGHDE